jgi:hypothetical protein
VSHQGHIHDSQQGDGDVADDIWDCQSENLSVHLWKFGDEGSEYIL